MRRAPRQGKMQYTTQNVVTSDLRRFLMDPGPKDGSILCHIRREKGKLGYPYYAVYLEARAPFPSQTRIRLRRWWSLHRSTSRSPHSCWVVAACARVLPPLDTPCSAPQAGHGSVRA